MKLASVNPSSVFQARLKSGMTQAEVAHRLRNAGLTKVTERSVRRWETGQNAPHANAIVALAQVLGVTVEDLCGGEDEDEEAEPLSFDSAINALVERIVEERVRAELKRREADSLERVL